MIFDVYYDKSKLFSKYKVEQLIQHPEILNYLIKWILAFQAVQLIM